MIDRDTALSRWKALAGDESPRPWTLDDLTGFFQRFRPDGAGLAKVFEGVEGGNEILPRLLDIYRAAAKGWPEDDDEFDAYFNVADPPPLDSRLAVSLARQYIANVRAMAVSLGRVGLAAMWEPSPPIVLVDSDASPSPGDDEAEEKHLGVVRDYMRSRSPRPGPLLWMEAAFRTIACDDTLKYYVLWPLYREFSTLDEPFRPYFELWKHGATCRFANDWTFVVWL